MSEGVHYSLLCPLLVSVGRVEASEIDPHGVHILPGIRFLRRYLTGSGGGDSDPPQLFISPLSKENEEFGYEQR